jgi:hypothetical protein
MVQSLACVKVLSRTMIRHCADHSMSRSCLLGPPLFPAHRNDVCFLLRLT